MKKYQLIFLGIIFVSVFSGCSLIPQVQVKDQNQDSAISKNIWKSADGGKTWQALDKVSGKARVSNVDVLSMAINPGDAKNIWVGLKQGGLLRSDDGGETWKFSDIFTSEKVYGLALDPADGRIIYASAVSEGKGKIFKSVDGGTAWKEIYTGAASGPLVISLDMDRKNPKVIYVSTSDNQAIKTEDGGESWKNIFKSDSPILKFDIDNSNRSLVYFMTLDGKVFRSKDAGASFEEISKNFSGNSLFNRNFSVLLADPNVSNMVYVAGGGGIARSKDAGNTWEKIAVLQNPESFPIGALAVSPGNSNEITYGAAQAVYKSQDGGINWTPSQLGAAGSAYILKYDPNDRNIIYAGFKK